MKYIKSVSQFPDVVFHTGAPSLISSLILQCLLVYELLRRSPHIVKLSARAKETADSIAALSQGYPSSFSSASSRSFTAMASSRLSTLEDVGLTWA